MDFPIIDLMDEGACYARLVQLAAPRRPGLPAVRRGPTAWASTAATAPPSWTTAAATAPGLQRLHRHGPARHPPAARPSWS